MPKAVNRSYGTLALKRCYRRNMVLGQIVAGCVALAIVFSVQMANGTSGSANVIEDETGGGLLPQLFDRYTIEPPAPPIISGRGGVALDQLLGQAGPVVLVDSEAIQAVNMIAGQADELFSTDDESADWLGGFGTDISFDNGGETIPPPDTFIQVETAPILIKSKLPDYPALARASGLTATVRIKAYVGKKGEVARAFDDSCTMPGCGFEENAVEAAYESVFRPAIQNGRPVGVWVTYSVKYVLNDCE